MSAGPFFFCDEELQSIAAKLRTSYRDAKPFPHVVLDDFIPLPTLDAVLEEFPGPAEIKWHSFDRSHEKKLANPRPAQMGANTRHLLAELNSGAFLAFLETLTGIQGLIPDPHFEGGGLHQITPGGYLNVHVDFSHHKRWKLDRRLNVLLYLNKDWKEEYGGQLELWSRDMKTREKRVLPVYNRLVVFSTTEHSWHGHPEPLTCPPGWTRKSLALYYYTNGRPADEAAASHTTKFRLRPGDAVPLRYDFFLEKLLPPFVLDAARVVRDRVKGAPR